MFPLGNSFARVREPATLAFATTSSESALPKAMQAMERLGVPPHIVGLVMPTGYSFNLDGSTLYLAVASVFVAQAAETTTGHHVGLGQQLTIMLALMVTSKGVAAVPRASLVVLLATLNSFLPAGLGPIGVAIIFGVDELMDMGRTCVNLIGNCLATIVVARWEENLTINAPLSLARLKRSTSTFGKARPPSRRRSAMTNEFAGMKWSAPVGSEGPGAASSGRVAARPSVWWARWKAFRFPINPEKQALLRAALGILA